MKKEIILNDDEGRYIMFGAVLCAINPQMSNIEVLGYFVDSGLDLHFFYGTRDPYIRIDDAIRFVNRLRNENLIERYEALYKEVLCWLVSVKAGTTKPLNALHNKPYCKALIYAYPGIEKEKDIQKFFLREVNFNQVNKSKVKHNKNRYSQHDENGYVYFIEGSVTKRIKIGFSKNPEYRLKQLQTGSSEPLRLLAQIIGSPVKEKELHHQFYKQHIHGDWFESSTKLRSLIIENTPNNGLQVTQKDGE